MYALGWSVFGELNFMDFGIRSPRSFRDLRDRISNGRAAGKIQPADRAGRCDIFVADLSRGWSKYDAIVMSGFVQPGLCGSVVLVRIMIPVGLF